MSELTSQPAVLSFPPSGGNHQGHPPITITIKNAADFAAFCETFQGLNAGNAQAPENNIDTTSPVSSKSTNQRLTNDDMNMKTFANFDSVMRNLNLAQTPKETAVGGTRHEGDAQGNISPLTASTPASGNPFDEPPDTNSDPITHQKEEDRLLGVPQTLMGYGPRGNSTEAPIVIHDQCYFDTWPNGKEEDTLPSDLAKNDQRAKASAAYVQNFGIPELTSIIDEPKNIKDVLTMGTSTELIIAVNGTKFSVPIALILGEKLTEENRIDLSSLLTAITTKLYTGKGLTDSTARTYLDNLKRAQDAAPIARILFQNIIKKLRSDVLKALAKFCVVRQWYVLHTKVQQLLKELNDDGVDLNEVFTGANSKAWNAYLSILWKKFHVSAADHKTLVENYNKKLISTVTLRKFSMHRISQLIEEHSTLVISGKRHMHSIARLLDPLVLVSELMREKPNSVEGMGIQAILSKKDLHEFIESGLLPEADVIAAIDGELADVRKSCSDERALVTKNVSTAGKQETVDDDEHDDGGKNRRNRGAPGAHKPRGCANLLTRTPIQDYIVKQRFAQKAADGRSFCIAYNIASQTLSKSHEEAEQACRDYNGEPEHGSCKKNCSHTFMDLSGFSSKTKKGKNGE